VASRLAGATVLLPQAKIDGTGELEANPS